MRLSGEGAAVDGGSDIGADFIAGAGGGVYPADEASGVMGWGSGDQGVLSDISYGGGGAGGDVMLPDDAIGGAAGAAPHTFLSIFIGGAAQDPVQDSDSMAGQSL